MKILTAQQIRDCDAYTIANEPILSIDLMERASATFVDAFEQEFSHVEKQASIFCGTGNNGGDGLVIARLLQQKGWEIDCYLVLFSENVSPDNATNQERLKASNIELYTIASVTDFPSKTHPIIIDALVGTGITRPLEGLLGEVVKRINEIPALRISVDLPSGLYDRGDCTDHLNRIVHADYTFTFQSPKRNFLLTEYTKSVGTWKVLDIRLDQEFIDKLPGVEFLLQHEDIQSKLLPRSAHSHKGTYGHAALICGSKGMMGAAVLATSSCLRSGVGLTTIMVPDIGYEILQSTCPEAMCISVGSKHVQDVPELKNYTAIGAGPGMGQNPETKAALFKIVESCEQTMVLDADALNLLAESDLSSVPKHSIITPHPKEFERLFGRTKNSHDRIQLLQEKAKAHELIILLKGHHTCVALPDGTLHFNTTGNPGMAKGGSGDVLTGLITGLVARGYSSEDAAIVGCYLHGLAGDLCAGEIGMEGMTAMDLVSLIPSAWRWLPGA